MAKTMYDQSLPRQRDPLPVADLAAAASTGIPQLGISAPRLVGSSLPIASIPLAE
jgi:hypothetical protein